MARRKRLKWGETPWDKLSREELLRTVQRYHSALSSLDSCLSMQREMYKQLHPNHPYFSGDGGGARALWKSSAILDSLHRRFNSEDIYRAFFRYADVLLFGPNPDDDFGNWGSCDNGHLWAPFKVGEECNILTCKKPLRPLEWRDLEPKP